MEQGRSKTGIASLPHVKLSPISAPGPTGERQEHLDAIVSCLVAAQRRRLFRKLDTLNQVGDRRLAGRVPTPAQCTGPDSEAVRPRRVDPLADGSARSHHWRPRRQTSRMISKRPTPKKLGPFRWEISCGSMSHERRRNCSTDEFDAADRSGYPRLR